MQVVGQGGTINLDALFKDGQGNLVDPVTPKIDIIDVNAAVQVNNDVPTRLSLGSFIYAYVVPGAGALGQWRAHWDGFVNGVLVSGDDFFTVVLAGSIVVDPTMPWMDAPTALLVTGAVITEAEMVIAADDVYRYMRWMPDINKDFLELGNMTQVMQKRSLGQAIAWQAAYRQRTSPLANLDRAPSSKTIGSYSISFGNVSNRGGAVTAMPTLADRASLILRTAGLCRWVGGTAPLSSSDFSIPVN